MAHFAKRSFWKSYEALTSDIRALADKSFALLQSNPRHPSLRFKKVGRFWSARVGQDYRAVGVEVDDGIVWILIVTHKEYESLIRS
ncbi:MAG TPA: hypothetical protein VGC16_02210 [Rhizomicrobium sp.]